MEEEKKSEAETQAVEPNTAEEPVPSVEPVEETEAVSAPPSPPPDGGNEQLKKKAVGGLFWKFLERCGAQGVQFVVSIILARLLAPEAYGTIALITVITNILNVFIDSGLGSALVQKKDADELDFSTVFFFNIFMCSVLYLALFFCAPLIANFYEDASLVAPIRVLGITLLISGVASIQSANISKRLLFRKNFFVSLIGISISATIGIIMAYQGYGIWALIAQQLTNAGINVITMFIVVRWMPKLKFSFQRLKSLFSFGWKLLVSALLDTTYNNVRQLIIGKKYSTEDLAYYNKGDHLPKLFITNINSSIDGVMFPVMSASQEDVGKVKNIMRRAIKTSTYIIFPCLMGMAVCADAIITLLLTDKWAFSVPYMQIFCATYALYPIHTANLNAMKAMGRSDLFLRLEIIKKAIGISVILVTLWFGPLAIALGALITAPLSSFVNAFPNKKLLGYSYWDQIKDLLPALALSAVMGAVVYCVNFFGFASWLTLLIQVPLGILIYVAGSVIFKLESFYYVWDIIKKLFKKKKKVETQV